LLGLVAQSAGISWAFAVAAAGAVWTWSLIPSGEYHPDAATVE
jgi:hypothetical protein